jgi:predicted ATP-grasp superfamily ATP-dependent carboligase
MTTLATLIILGASVRAAAEGAVRAGIEPYCIDLFADEDTRALGPVRKIDRYPAEFLAALADAPQAPWMYTGSLENYPRLIARMAQMRPLLGNNDETLKLVRHPAWLASAVQGTGVRFPETRDAGDFVPPDDAWLMKPRRSGGGMGIRSQESARRGQVVQRLIEGEAFSASFLAKDPKVEMLGAALQWAGTDFGAPQPFQYAGSIAPFELSDHEKRALQGLAEKLAGGAGLRGLFGLDLIRGEEGLWLIEVNPRYTASMELLEALQSRSFVAEHCAEFGYTLCTTSENLLSKELSTAHYSPGGEGGPSQRAPKALSKLLSLGLRASRSAATLGKRIVYADQAGIVGSRYRAVIDVIKSTAGVITADRPTIGSVIDNGSPICTVIAAQESGPAVADLLLRAANQIRQSLDPPRPPS